MGSSGHNTFGDYQPPPEGKTRCDKSIDTALEDVGRLPYYRGAKAVPPAGTPVRVSSKLVANRVVVEEAKSGHVVGNLPVIYNYIPICLEKGYAYEGQVTASRNGPVPIVEVHLDPV